MIARRLGRAPSTVSRELRRNADRGGGYRATTAHALAYERASRPKPAKLAVNVALRELVQDDLLRRYSPEQIAGRLRRQFPDDLQMRVSHETIYMSLFVQPRGALRKELTRYSRSRRMVRRPRAARPANGQGQLRDIVHISARPAEAIDRAVPGHWEGDLLLGRGNTAIATLVERSTGWPCSWGYPTAAAQSLCSQPSRSASPACPNSWCGH